MSGAAPEPAAGSPEPGPRSASFWRVVTLGVVLFALANALYSAWHQGWTYDEPFNLEWSERLLTTRNAEREITHFNSKTPVTLPNALASLALRRAAASEQATRFAARLPSAAWLALLLATVFALGRAWFGLPAACIATVAAALDPNLVAHGSVATVDVAYALGTLWTVAAAAAFGARPSPGRAACLGLALGFALAVKFSAILLLPVLLLLPALRRPPRREWPRWLAYAFVVAAVAAATVCAAYLFLDVGAPLGSRRWVWRPLRHLAHAVPWARLPLPAAFLTGYDVSLAAERGDWNVVILSRWYPHGVWFYFAVLWLLKTPLLVLLAEGWGLARAARARLGAGALGARLLLATLLVHLAYFSLLFRTQVGYRFVLMCVPIAYLLAAAGLAPLAARRHAAVAALLVVAVAILENGMYFGNPLSFTNAAVWPKRQAFRLMADSNLDWGQHDEAMERWGKRSGAGTHLNPLHLLPGTDTFSVNEVAGVDDFERHRFLRENADPAGHIDHTHVWFDVDDALFNRFLDERRRLAPEPSAGAICPATPAYEALSPQSPGHLFLPGLSEAETSRTWIVCVSAPRGTDLGLRARSGELVLAPYRDGAPCEGEVITGGHEAWHRLLPGTHALCVAERASPDGALPPPFEGSWLVTDSDASILRIDAPARSR
jgi:4-amino-4-deoxy-L-arabinose transferase-like glycosyltransferase